MKQTTNYRAFKWWRLKRLGFSVAPLQVNNITFHRDLSLYEFVCKLPQRRGLYLQRFVLRSSPYEETRIPGYRSSLWLFNKLKRETTYQP